MYEIILKHLLEKGSITSYEAIQKYGCTRLSQYIYLLRKNGYVIQNVNKTTTNRYGQKVTYSQYVLVDEVA